MKKTLSLITFCLFAMSFSGQDIAGSWLGTLDMGPSQMRLVFNVLSEDHGYTGTLDSPDQGVTGFPLSRIELDGSKLTITINELGVIYTGTVNSESTHIEGTFKQGLYELTLDLEQGTVTVNRPQEPNPLYPYRCEDVKFENLRDGVTLSGTLTLPAQNGRFPTVILVTGSGPQNRDEEVFGHKPFLVIADHLTRNGIAVLRYDDRGVGESTGIFAGATSEDFTRDALAAFDFLCNRDEIDPARIGIIGHSEGGTIGFMAAARQPELGFVVSMAGSLLPGDSTLVLQNRDILVMQGMDKELADAYAMALRDIYKAKNRHEGDYISENSEEIVKGAAGYQSLPPLMQSNLAEVLAHCDPWLDFFLAYDPSCDIGKTLCPVFAINGRMDVQVAAEANLRHAAKILSESGNDNFTTKIYPGRNHMFQECTTGAFEEYNRIEQTISPEVLDDITRWILEITK
ncbi:MAG: alpha/beta fold hydrolase [Rikenellaceae bacterium]|nr:alpha/beta fold hydrolase [Rikenellaceae bacterium]